MEGFKEKGMKRFSYKTILIWICSLVLGTIVTTLVSMYIPRLWDTNRLIRGLTLLVMLGISVCFFRKIIQYSIYLWEMETWVKRGLYLLLSIVICSLIYLLYGEVIKASVPAAWLGGHGTTINQVINLTLIIVIQPYLLWVIVAAGGKLYDLWSKNKNSFKGVIENYYPRVFVVIFLGISLLPLSGVTDIHNIEAKFWGREWLISSYADLCVTLGNRVFDSALIGKDGWLFYTGANSMNDYQKTSPFSSQDVEEIQRKLDGFYDRLTAQGIKLLVVIPPNKNTIYPEYMPDEIAVIGKESRLDQLINYEQQHGKAKILDLRPALKAARSQHQIFYQKDTHWNNYGAFIAYQEIMKVLQGWFPNIKAHPLSDFRFVLKGKEGDIASNLVKSTNASENELVMEPLFQQNYTSRSWLEDKDSRGNLTTWSADSNLPRLLMYRDSFTIALQPFLSDHFSRAVYIFDRPENETYVTTEKPDVVIIEVTERYLSLLHSIPGD
jgi:alginate O-acetyltransferase complex protein AlgJ